MKIKITFMEKFNLNVNIRSKATKNKTDGHSQ